MQTLKLSLSIAIGCAFLSACGTTEVAQKALHNITASPSDYQLEKVVFFSRHGIRAPLIGYGSALAEATPHTWPTWSTKGGHLTPKGAQLETLFGAYLREWLSTTGLVTSEQCPQDDMLIYTNSLPRTIATGEAFAQNLSSKECKIKVHHLEEIGKMDNTFNPIVRSPVDDVFVAKAIKSIDETLGGDGFASINQRLAQSYAELEKVLDYQNSIACKEKGNCHIAALENSLSFEQGKEPKTSGALRNGTGAADSFVLQYYEGFPSAEVAWGNINSDEAWRKITAIKDLYNDVLFGSPVIAKEAATPLLTFIQNSFTDEGYKHPLIEQARKAKVVMLVGHDSNVGSLLPLLKVKPYQLPNQYEHTPTGGKLAFQLWKDSAGEQWVKLDYLYQSTEQLRQATVLNATNPPQSVTLELADCPINPKGFCKYSDFVQAMKKALQ